MRSNDRSVDREVARIASRQHGVISLEQLLANGLTRAGVRRRVVKGTLHSEFRGVYRVGHRAPSVEARYLGAVLACGERARLSGFAAAFVYGLIKGSAPPPEVSTVADRTVRGVITHRVRHLDPLDIAVYRQIPITTVPRTLVDLAATLSLDALARACHEAEVRHRTTASMMAASLARRPKAPGSQKLRAIFDGDVRVTLSKLERAFLAVLRAGGLPLPKTNRPAGASARPEPAATSSDATRTAM